MRSDLRYAFRSFLKSPAFAAISVLTLALGIGANTAIFSVVNAVLLRPLPYESADRLYRVRHGTSFPDMRDWIQQTSSFESIGGFRPQAFDYTPGPEAERLDGALVTGGMMTVLKARPLVGRLLTFDDERTGSERVVVVSAGFWRSRLGSDPAVAGRRITFNGTTYTIVGVLGGSSSLPGISADVFAPHLPEAPREAESRGAHTLRAVVRLRDGVSQGQAQEEMNALAARLEQQYPNSNRGVRFVLLPLADSLVGQIRPALVLLLSTVAFVLLIACVNVANLLIARGAARRGELAVRAALGAGRTRIARQLLTESALLAGAGGLLSLAVAHWTLRAIVALAPAGVPRLEQSTLDVPVLALTAALSIGTGVLFGILPAMTAARTPVGDVARASGRSTAAGGRARSTLMVAEIALSLLLVIGAGLLLRSFYTLTQQPLGFVAAQLVTANITFNGQRYFDVGRRTRIFEAFEEHLASLPGVQAVALTTDLPIGGSPIFHNLAFEGRPMAEGTEPEVYYRGVSASYFDALGIPLKRGRTFTPADRAGAPLVAIVNEAFVREYYPTEEPLGRRIRWVSGSGEWITIVGVAADVRGLSLETGEVPAVHMPYRQEQAAWRMWMDVAVRTELDPIALGKTMRQELARLDSAVPLTKLGTMSDVLAQSVASRRFNLFLLGAFAALSLLLAAAGTYGVMSHAVTQRTREMGVRLALGARPSDLVRLIAAHGLALTFAGVALGLAAALIVGRVWGAFLSGMLFQVTSTDIPTLAGAALVLIAAAALATVVPARRAARVDPLIALRSE